MKANVYPGRGFRPDWNDIRILQQGCLRPHAYRIPFPDLVTCRHAVTDNRRYASPYVLVLNQGWEARQYASILHLPENILSFRSGFTEAAVPAAAPGYVAEKAIPDAAYPFPVLPPEIPADQPLTVYRRSCRLPLFWGGLRKHLVLLGISAACHVFANGRLAGYTQGTGLSATFDLTGSLHDGDNEIFILLYPDCSGSYLEYISERPGPGLIHDIYFEAEPPVFIQDLHIQTRPLPDQDPGAWQLDLSLQVASCRISLESPHVRILLAQNDQTLSDSIWPVTLIAAEHNQDALPVQTTGNLQASLELTGILSWSDEDPQVYDLFISLEERGHRELVCVHQTVGFRHLVRQGKGLLLNGRPLSLKAAILNGGTFSHGLSGPLFRQVAAQLCKLKQNNLNALFIRHFPPDPILLELCDLLGVCVIEEAPLAAGHERVRDLLRGDTDWRLAAEDRLERTIRRDINHPSVVLWSADIFSGSDDGLSAQLAAKICQVDASRPIHRYDTDDIAAEYDRFHSDGTPVSLDWFAYPESSLAGRCYIRFDEPDERLWREVRQVLRPLDIRAIDVASGAFLFINRMQWRAASSLRIAWTLLRDGKQVLAGELDPLRAEPGQEHDAEVWLGDATFHDHADYILRFEAAWNESRIWADAGSEAFSLEFPVLPADRSGSLPAQRAGGRLRLESDRHHLILSGSRFWLVFSRVNGGLESWRIGEKEILAPPRDRQDHLFGSLNLTLSRPPDRSDGALAGQWEHAGYHHLRPYVVSVEAGCDGQSAVIETLVDLAAPGRTACARWLSRCEVFAAGDLKLFASLTPLRDDLPAWPCFGLRAALKADFARASWYGSGPCLARLQHGKQCGVFDRSLGDASGDDMPERAEPGCYSDVRWLSLKDHAGFGLQIRADQLFSFLVGSQQDGQEDRGFAPPVPGQQPIRLHLIQQQASQGYAAPQKAVWHLGPSIAESGSR